jgi:hypothetical protein
MRRDQVWLWGHVAGAHDRYVGGGRSSRVTPGAGCRRLGVRNLVMVALHGEPAPPLAAHADDLAGVDRVVWSVLDDGHPPRDDVDAVLELAAGRPTIAGGIVDNTLRVPAPGLRHIADRLHAAPRRLPLWGVAYTAEVDDGLAVHLEPCDVVTLWSHATADLYREEPAVRRFAAATPGKRRLVGVYLWDFPGQAPVGGASLARSLESAAAWVDGGLLEGVVVLASSLLGMGLDAEVVLQRWLSMLA